MEAISFDVGEISAIPHDNTIHLWLCVCGYDSVSHSYRRVTVTPPARL